MLMKASFKVFKVFAFLCVFLLCTLLTIMQLFSSSEKEILQVVPQPQLNKPIITLPISVNNSAKNEVPLLGPAIGDHQEKHVLSRRKRFVAFPEGSSLSTAVCMTTGVLGNPEVSYLSLGLNWGIAYDLPNASWVLRHAQGFPDQHKTESVISTTDAPDNSSDVNKDVKQFPIAIPSVKRRQRRELYGKLETLMDNMGYNGRECILRALCESRQYFERTKMGMIGEMLRVIFSLPKQRIFTRELHENADIKIYDHAYRKARDIDCAQQYECSFSLLELALGRYSTPPPDYYKTN